MTTELTDEQCDAIRDSIAMSYFGRLPSRNTGLFEQAERAMIRAGAAIAAPQAPDPAAPPVALLFAAANEMRIALLAVDSLASEHARGKWDKALAAYSLQHPAEHFSPSLETCPELVGGASQAEAALHELVECKDLKEQWERSMQRDSDEMSAITSALRDEYKRRQPLAWAAARAVLASQSSARPQSISCPRCEKAVFIQDALNHGFAHGRFDREKARPQVRELVAKLEEWRHCMSYNDSYFGEPAGLVKRTVRALTHALAVAPASPAPAAGRSE